MDLLKTDDSFRPWPWGGPCYAYDPMYVMYFAFGLRQHWLDTTNQVQERNQKIPASPDPVSGFWVDVDTELSPAPVPESLEHNQKHE